MLHFRNVQPAFILAGNHARNGKGLTVSFRNMFTLGTCFQVFRTISDEQRDKEQESVLEKRRQNLRNLSGESLERSRGRRRRENFNDEHR